MRVNSNKQLKNLIWLNNSYYNKQAKYQKIN
jgi:hypothetical protein